MGVLARGNLADNYQPEVLYSSVVEIDERVCPVWHEFLDQGRGITGNDDKLIETDSGVVVQELIPIGELSRNGRRLTLDINQVKLKLTELYEQGYRSLAIVFAHSYLYPGHERQVAEVARNMGFANVSVSSELDSKIGFVARGQSATADAYLTPEVKRYLTGFVKGFKGKLQDDQCRVSFMQSDGALADFRKFSGLRAILCECPMPTWH